MRKDLEKERILSYFEEGKVKEAIQIIEQTEEKEVINLIGIRYMQSFS